MACVPTSGAVRCGAVQLANDRHSNTMHNEPYGKKERLVFYAERKMEEQRNKETHTHIHTHTHAHTHARTCAGASSLSRNENIDSSTHAGACVCVCRLRVCASGVRAWARVAERASLHSQSMRKSSANLSAYSKHGLWVGCAVDSRTATMKRCVDAVASQMCVAKVFVRSFGRQPFVFQFSFFRMVHVHTMEVE